MIKYNIVYPFNEMVFSDKKDAVIDPKDQYDPKASFSSTWTKNFQMSKLDLEKAEEPEIKLPTFTGP